MQRGEAEIAEVVAKLAQEFCFFDAGSAFMGSKGSSSPTPAAVTA